MTASWPRDQSSESDWACGCYSAVSYSVVHWTTKLPGQVSSIIVNANKLLVASSIQETPWSRRRKRSIHTRDAANIQIVGRGGGGGARERLEWASRLAVSRILSCHVLIIRFNKTHNTRNLTELINGLRPLRQGDKKKTPPHHFSSINRIIIILSLLIIHPLQSSLLEISSKLIV